MIEKAAAGFIRLGRKNSKKVREKVRERAREYLDENRQNPNYKDPRTAKEAEREKSAKEKNIQEHRRQSEVSERQPHQTGALDNYTH